MNKIKPAFNCNGIAAQQNNQQLKIFASVCGKCKHLGYDDTDNNQRWPYYCKLLDRIGIWWSAREISRNNSLDSNNKNNITKIKTLCPNLKKHKLMKKLNKI